MNLVRNASDALGDVEDRPRRMLVRTRPGGDRTVELMVKDNGVGLGTDDPEQLFRAFHTTKPNGMGIGLSVSRSIVESHGGRLWAEANDGPGASFSFAIPQYGEGESNAPGAPPPGLGGVEPS